MKSIAYVGFHIMLALTLAASVYPVFCNAGTSQSPITKEYFVQQEAHEAVLIKIYSFEAEFESRLTTQDEQVLLLSALPGNRIAPVYQYVSAPKIPRQLKIEVSSKLHTGRSQFEIELVRMAVWDHRSETVSRAYQLLSFGMQAGGGKSRADWTVKIDSLVNAGRLFERFGMEEMRLWSNYLAAYLIQFHLHDYSMAYTMSQEILADLKGRRFKKIEMATLKLQAVALIGLKNSGSFGTSSNGHDPVQASLSRVAGFAGTNGFAYEQAWALGQSGSEYLSESSWSRALAQFAQAVEIADALADEVMATRLRESIVQIHGAAGNVPASGEVLREIEANLLEGGDGDKLALNLLAQGRLSIASFQYPKALETLYQALGYENDSAIRKQVNFELAQVFYNTGQLDESLAYLKRAEVTVVSGGSQGFNSVLDMGVGLRMMADIYRSRGEFDKMRKARNAEGAYSPVPVQYHYDKGLDELAPPASNRQRAKSFFRQSYKLAVESGDADFRHLSHLQLCVLNDEKNADRDRCDANNVREAFKHLRASGVPVFALEALNLQTRILLSRKQYSQATANMDGLLDELLMFRQRLPGVLGAWYQQRREFLFDRYLDLLIRASSQKDRQDGFSSLLALSKIRHIENIRDAGLVSATDSARLDQLRAQLAQRVRSRPGQDHTRLDSKINQGLDQIRAQFRKDFNFLSKSGLHHYLRSLRHDECVLTYHISPSSTRVWVAKKGEVQTHTIVNPTQIYATVQKARQTIATTSLQSFDEIMGSLGKHLLEPVADLLAGTIYWIPAGPLLGVPLDALRLNGKYLLEQHSVVGLMSFPANSNPAASLQGGVLKKIFLAGHPQDYSENYATRLDTSAEIEAVADRFIGPGLRIVQGVALLADEFHDGYFAAANLLHLTMPGLIDLGDPDNSALELSGSEGDPGHTTFTSLDIRSQSLAADMVFLSATRIIGMPPTAYRTEIDLVSDFTAAGAKSVISTLWVPDNKTAERFVSDFYRGLTASGGVADALSNTKRHHLVQDRARGLYDWAAYQLFIR